MLSSGEMCLLVHNLKPTYSKIDRMNYVNNINRRNVSKQPVARRLFGLPSDSVDNSCSNLEFAMKHLNEQFKVDRERFLRRFNFDIESDYDLENRRNVMNSDVDNVLASSTHACSKVVPKGGIRLDENVNIEYVYDESKIAIEDRIAPSSLEREEEIVEEKTSPLSPTKSKALNSEIRRHPYTLKKQSHLTDFWKIKRRSLDLTSKQSASKTLLQENTTVSLEHNLRPKQ